MALGTPHTPQGLENNWTIGDSILLTPTGIQSSKGPKAKDTEDRFIPKHSREQGQETSNSRAQEASLQTSKKVMGCTPNSSPSWHLCFSYTKRFNLKALWSQGLNLEIIWFPSPYTATALWMWLLAWVPNFTHSNSMYLVSYPLKMACSNL